MEIESIISHLRENIHNFTVFSLDAQSIKRSIFDQVYSIMSNLYNHRLHFSAICFQETWLDENADVSLIQLPGYHLISKIWSSKAILCPLVLLSFFILKNISLFNPSYPCIIFKILSGSYTHHTIDNNKLLRCRKFNLPWVTNRINRSR